MKWSDDYTTGIEFIDNQHKTIFKMADDFRSALNEGKGALVYDSLLKTLDRYVQTHFSFEEQRMKEYNCPTAQRNIEAHRKFIDVLSGYQHRYSEIGFDRADAYNLVNTIDHWLTDHICRIDVHLKPCVHKP